MAISNGHLPQRDHVGFLQYDAIDVVEAKAPQKDADPSIRIDPQWAKKEKLDADGTRARTLVALASRNKQTDTSGWLG